jgi:hypothetical protein
VHASWRATFFAGGSSLLAIKRDPTSGTHHPCNIAIDTSLLLLCQFSQANGAEGRSVANRESSRD